MKRILGLVLGLMLFASVAYCGQATVTETVYGYYVTGGTDYTTITSDRVQVRTIAYSATTANNVAAFYEATTSGTVWWMKSAGVSGVNQCYISFGSNGVIFNGLGVVLQSATDVVQIYK